MDPAEFIAKSIFVANEAPFADAPVGDATVAARAGVTHAATSEK